MNWDTIEQTITQLQEEYRAEQRALTREMHGIKGYSAEYQAAARRHDNVTAEIDALWEVKERLEQIANPPRHPIDNSSKR